MLCAALLAAGACGCTSMGTTVRAQNPDMQNIHHHPSHAQPLHAVSDHLQDSYHEHHNTDTTYYHGASAMSPPAGAGYEGAYCPPGNGYGGGHDFGIHHGFSYSYQRPNDLVYPSSGFGGTVVYPYYTHRGPSDFFRK